MKKLFLFFFVFFLFLSCSDESGKDEKASIDDADNWSVEVSEDSSNGADDGSSAAVSDTDLQDSSEEGDFENSDQEEEVTGEKVPCSDESGCLEGESCVFGFCAVYISRQIGGEEMDMLFSAKSAGANDAYIAGFTDDGLGVEEGLGGEDGFVAKLDAGGDIKWVDLIGNDRNDAVHDLDSKEGFVVVSGRMELLRKDLPKENPCYDEVCQYGFVALYDEDGEKKWEKIFGESSANTVFNVRFGENDEIFAVGTTNGVVDDSFQNKGKSDFFILKMNSEGEVLFSNQIGGPDNDVPDSLVVFNGKPVVVGHFKDELDGNKSVGGMDIFAVEFDASGEKVWLRTFGSSENDVVTDSFVKGNEIFISAYTKGGFEKFENKGGEDFLFAGLKEGGEFEILSLYGTEMDDRVNAMLPMEDGRLLFSGYSMGTFPDMKSSGKADAFFGVFVDNSAEVLHQWGSERGEGVESVFIRESGNVVFAGSTPGKIDTGSAAGGWDVFITELSFVRR